MLSTGFMIGGACGAVASADTDSSKPSSSQGSDSAAPAANPTRGPIATIADSLRKQVQTSLQGTVQSVTGSLNSLPSPAQIQAALPKPPAVSFGGTPTVHGTSTFGSSAPTTDPTPSASPPSATPLSTPSNSTPSTSTPATSTPSTGTPATTVPAALNPLAAASQAAQDVVTPVTNALAAAANSAATTAASIPAALPITQVVTGVQDVLASVASAGVSLSQLPADLSDLLGVSAVSTGSSTGHVGTPATVTAPVPLPTSAPLPPILAMAGVDGMPATAPVVGHATPLDVIAAGANPGVASTSAPLLAPHDTNSTDVLTVVEHVIGAFVASVSLTALIAWALPGIGGLLGTCAAGIRVGYRQAKAGSELPDTAISRFVGSGPVGVVRSGSLISLRPRATRAARQSVPEEAPTRRLHAVPAAPAQVDLLDKAV